MEKWKSFLGKPEEIAADFLRENKERLAQMERLAKTGLSNPELERQREIVENLRKQAGLIKEEDIGQKYGRKGDSGGGRARDWGLPKKEKTEMPAAAKSVSPQWNKKEKGK